jgi:hypothetical protein
MKSNGNISYVLGGKMHGRLLLVIVLGLIALAGLTAVPNYAQELAPGSIPEASLDVEAYVGDRIPIQGRLTSPVGAPLTGNHSLTFKLYEVDSGGSALCTDTQTIAVTNGFFDAAIQSCAAQVDGRQLYLGIQVGADPEMTPRQPVYGVPYALSLRPGAKIIGPAPLYVENVLPADGMVALAGRASGTSGQNYGVFGVSNSPTGFGGYFTNTAGGVGLRAQTIHGRALEATSTNGPGLWAASTNGSAVHAQGKITSSTPSYIWISGNDMRPRYPSDTTIIEMDSIGGARMKRGTDAVGEKWVMLPITIPGVLYGQNVRLSAVDIYWVGQSDFDGITAVLMRRQNGVCPTCYLNIINDTSDQLCSIGSHPSGCIATYNPTSNNVLSPDSGVLYLTLRVNFGAPDSYVQIGGVRLTLVHQ